MHTITSIEEQCMMFKQVATNSAEEMIGWGTQERMLDIGSNMGVDRQMKG